MTFKTWGGQSAFCPPPPKTWGGHVPLSPTQTRPMVSSLYFITIQDGFKSSIKRTNRTGPNQDPCGTDPCNTLHITKNTVVKNHPKVQDFYKANNVKVETPIHDNAKCSVFFLSFSSLLHCHERGPVAMHRTGAECCHLSVLC